MEDKEIEERYFVISDTHLGSNKKGSNVPDYEVFIAFLEWMKSIPENGTDVWIIDHDEGSKKKILPPTKIILLGDILDLWDPDKADRSSVLKQASKPFALLSEINCDKIYVVGNHDQDLYELADILKEENESLDLNTSKIQVHRRHYPDNINNGVSIGKKKFAFIHGHQYDKYQITESISKKLKIRFDPLDIIQDISGVSVIKSVFKEKRPTIIYGSLVFLILYWGSRQSTLSLFSKMVQFPSLMEFIEGFLGFIPFSILLSSVVIIPSVKMITWFQGRIWKFITPRDKSVKEVIERGFYNKDLDKMEVDVVVFGHTHMAGGHYLEDKKRLFVNTGSWVKTAKADITRDPNTFVYIDNNNIKVLSWLGTRKDEMPVFKNVEFA